MAYLPMQRLSEVDVVPRATIDIVEDQQLAANGRRSANEC